MYNEIMIKYNAASLIGRTREAVHTFIVAELEKHGIVGMVPSHGDILVFLYQKNELSVKELSEKIHKTQPTVTVLVNKLEKLGYVERLKSPEDSRVTLIRLTDQALQIQPVFQRISDELNEKLYGGLSEEQKEQLEASLERIYSRFQ